MTDKVQKIREEVVRLQNELIQEKEKDYGSDVDDACILELQNVLTYIDSLQEEPVSDNLEEAAKEYVTKEGYLAGLHYNSMVRSFKAGAKWQKEQMMKEAISGEVKEGLAVGYFGWEDSGWIETDTFHIEKYALKANDKVKLIIFKED